MNGRRLLSSNEILVTEWTTKKCVGRLWYRLLAHVTIKCHLLASLKDVSILIWKEWIAIRKKRFPRWKQRTNKKISLHYAPGEHKLCSSAHMLYLIDDPASLTVRSLPCPSCLMEGLITQHWTLLKCSWFLWLGPCSSDNNILIEKINTIQGEYNAFWFNQIVRNFNIGQIYTERGFLIFSYNFLFIPILKLNN